MCLFDLAHEPQSDSQPPEGRHRNIVNERRKRVDPKVSLGIHAHDISLEFPELRNVVEHQFESVMSERWWNQTVMIGFVLVRTFT
jgi:hypothetical protein